MTSEERNSDTAGRNAAAKGLRRCRCLGLCGFGERVLLADVSSRPIVVALLLSGLLAACSTAPARKPGGYYLDDGPGSNPPANLNHVPDAVPKAEPIKASTARPYTALGRTYTPMTQLGPYEARGLASWYGRRYHGQPTASGERYDMYAMTAAHATLPIPSYARVTNLRTGQSVIVRINDRGPFRGGRLIDLSYVAAYKLGIVNSGSDIVEVQSIVPGQAVQIQRIASRATPEAQPVQEPPVTREAAGSYVQLGSFGQRSNAESFLVRMRTELAGQVASIGLHSGAGLYRVLAGPYPDREQALQAATLIQRSLDLKPLVITR